MKKSKSSKKKETTLLMVIHSEEFLGQKVRKGTMKKFWVDSVNMQKKVSMKPVIFLLLANSSILEISMPVPSIIKVQRETDNKPSVKENQKFIEFRRAFYCFKLVTKVTRFIDKQISNRNSIISIFLPLRKRIEIMLIRSIRPFELRDQKIIQKPCLPFSLLNKVNSTIFI